MVDRIKSATNWRDAALCRRVGEPELWFPIGTGPLALEQTAQAKAVCSQCPVIWSCLQFGLTETHGIYGGMTPEERVEMRARARALAQQMWQPAEVSR